MFLSPPEAYEYCLKQAARELGGGVPGSRSVGTEVVDIPDVGYDRKFREPGNPVNQQGVATMAVLRLRPGPRPSEAIRAMYASMTQSAPISYLFGSWFVDCAEWVQVHHFVRDVESARPLSFRQALRWRGVPVPQSSFERGLRQESRLSDEENIRKAVSVARSRSTRPETVNHGGRNIQSSRSHGW